MILNEDFFECLVVVGPKPAITNFTALKFFESLFPSF